MTAVNDRNLWPNMLKSVIDRGQWQKKVSLTGCILYMAINVQPRCATWIYLRELLALLPILHIPWHSLFCDQGILKEHIHGLLVNLHIHILKCTIELQSFGIILIFSHFSRMEWGSNGKEITLDSSWKWSIRPQSYFNTRWTNNNENVLTFVQYLCNTIIFLIRSFVLFGKLPNYSTKSAWLFLCDTNWAWKRGGGGVRMAIGQ